MKTVYINRGHSNYDSGAVDYINERKYVVKVGDYMEEYLKKNYVVNVYGNSGTVGDLITICNDANRKSADLTVSIHCNSCKERNTARGFEAWVYDESRKELGEAFEKQIVKIGQTSRGVKYDADLIILKHTDMPAVLVELLFVNSKADYLAWGKNSKKMGIALAKAVAEYLHLEQKNPKYRVVVNALNIREKSAVTSKKLGTLKKGDIVTGTVCGTWLKHSKGYSRIKGISKTYMERVIE